MPATEQILQTCPRCGGDFNAKNVRNTCPHCQLLTEARVDGRAAYVYVEPKPQNGQVFSVTDLLKEFTAPHMPDCRGLSKILSTVSIDDVCEESGLTPLLWSIENNSKLSFLFCMARGADPSKHGTGDFDTSPVELAIKRGCNEFVERLVSRGAQAPPEVLGAITEKREAAREALRTRGEVVKKTIARLKREMKKDWFLTHLDYLESVFGIAPTTARGRGIKAFAKVPLASLAEKAQSDIVTYFSRMIDHGRAAGVSIFCEKDFDLSKNVRVLVAPSTSLIDVVAVSNLMSPDDTTFTRMEVAASLPALNDAYPFRILECGRNGILGVFVQAPDDPGKVAKRLLEICPHYGSDLAAGRPDPWVEIDELQVVEDDVRDSGGFFLSWD